ncbi:MAG: D-aminoacyl-tRNA deacylase [Chloroflexota bacterium]
MARIVAQRVSGASVCIDGEVVGEIGRGLAILLGIHREDDDAAIDKLAAKAGVVRIFEDAGGKMNLSTSDAGGSMLVVSQFTLYADARKGRRPSFIDAAGPELGERLYDRFVLRLREQGYAVETGRFGARMLVRIENDGPVTVILDSQEL